MNKILSDLKKYRFLLGQLVRKGIALKYRKSYLGIVWSLLEPLLTMLVLTIVFGSWYGKSDKSFPVYILTGRLLYTYFSNGTKMAMTSIRRNASMIKKVYVPKYIYPLSEIIYNYIIFLISLVVLVGVGVVLKIQPTIYLLEAIVPLFLLFILTWGVGMILATMSVFFRDMEYLWNVILMIIMYASAIFYKADTVISNGYGWLFKLNPLYLIITNFRECVMYGQPLSPEHLIPAALFSFGCLGIGLFAFSKKQDDFILYI